MILAGQKALVASYVASRIRDMGTPPEKDYEAIGVVGKGGELIGGVVYTNYHELAPGQCDIMMSAAGEPGWLTPLSLRVFFSYAFEQLSCVRITTIAAKSNRKARSLNERLGFVLEGVLRDGRGIGHDAVAYGMLKRDCKWIKRRAST
jgi:RimJ/RimL family protein N-acetyltransferase